MTLQMRPYQTRAIEDVYYQWGIGKQFVVLVMPTGSGKSATLSEIARMERDRGQTLLILAHRQELISQLSETLARNGLMHNMICAQPVKRFATTLQNDVYGRSYYSTSEKRIFVASVQSLKDADIAYFVNLGDKCTIIQDEYHHATKQSKTWGKALTPIVDAGARGLGVTATPERADGRGLSRETDGYGDVMVLGPTMRELITMSFLSDYKIFCPPVDLHLENVRISKASGDYDEKELKAEIGKSRLVGDIVDHYLKIAPGKRGLTFTVGVDTAEEVAAQYRAQGVPAMALSGKNTSKERIDAIKAMTDGKVLQIVNDMIFTEGTDIPSVEVVSFARPTQSYGLYCQMFGRALRTFPGKSHAIIIDAVGNVQRHGLPDAYREWTLDRRERSAKKDSGAEALTVCVSCFQPFPARNSICPHCGERVKAAAEGRSLEQVEGDLTELTPEILAQMRGEADRVMESPDAVKNRFLAAGAPQIAAAGAAKQHRLRMEAQIVLRDVMQRYGDFYMGTLGCGLREAQITFWQQFGTDVLSAQALGRADAEALTDRVRDHLLQMGVAA